MTGDLAGAAPTPRQVREVVLRIEQVSPGVLKVSAPFGWVGGLARTPPELARLVSQSFREAQVAAYARWRQSAYTQGGGERKKRRVSRRDVFDPAEWRVDDDGMWIDPGLGRRWHPDTQVVRRVMDKREGLGLPRTPVAR